MLKNSNYIYDSIIIADEKITTKKFCKKTTGVDLSLKNLYSLATPGLILKDKTIVGEYKLISPKPMEYHYIEKDGSVATKSFNGYFLEKGTYLCELNEGCKFSNDDVGYIILRSSLNRNGVSLYSAVWDNGFTTQSSDGKVIEGMSVRITVDTDEGIYIEKDARVGQLLVFQAPKGGESYSTQGHQFQGRGLK